MLGTISHTHAHTPHTPHTHSQHTNTTKARTHTHTRTPCPAACPPSPGASKVCHQHHTQHHTLESRSRGAGTRATTPPKRNHSGSSCTLGDHGGSRTEPDQATCGMSGKYKPETHPRARPDELFNKTGQTILEGHFGACTSTAPTFAAMLSFPPMTTPYEPLPSSVNFSKSCV